MSPKKPDDTEIAAKIAKALIAVEEIEGVELLEVKARFKAPQGSGLIYFQPWAWREHGRRQQLKVSIHRPDNDGVCRSAKFYLQRGMY